MAFKLPTNVVSKNNMKNILYVVTLALAVGYLMNRQNIALVSLLFIAGAVYMLKKDVVLALVVSIIVTNILLAMNYFKRFEGFKEGAKAAQKTKALTEAQKKDSLQIAEMEKNLEAARNKKTSKT